MNDIELRKNEEIVRELKPHPIAFIDLYAIFIYLLIINVIFSIYYGEIENWLKQFNIAKWIPQIQGYLTLTLWILSIIIPFLAMAFTKAEWKWFILSLIAILLGITFKLKFQIPEQIPALIIGLIGISLVEMYRKGHTYYITNQRIITELKFMRQKQREISHTKLNELIVIKGALGRIFNVGTIIPVTATRMGLGEDISIIGVGATSKVKSTGISGEILDGKTLTVPRGASAYILFGIKNPFKIRELISRYAWEQEGAPILRKIAEDIEKLTQQREETKNT